MIKYSNNLYIPVAVYLTQIIHFLIRVCDGTRQPEEVLREQIDKYREVFERSVAQVNWQITDLFKFYTIDIR